MRKRKIRTLGVIPARWASTRFPGKSLALLCGKPLIQWVIERTALAKALDKLVVATDDRRIAKAAAACGVEAVMTKAAHPSGTDRTAEAAAQFPADIIVNIQGDEPAIDPVLIDSLVETMRADKKWDMATAAAPLGTPAEAGNPSICKVVFNAAGQALYFSRFPIPYLRDKTGGCPPDLFWRHIGIYLYRKKFLARFVAAPPSALETAEALEQLRALHIGARIKVLKTSHCGTGVDTPADIAQAEAALKRINAEGKKANFGVCLDNIHGRT